MVPLAQTLTALIPEIEGLPANVKSYVAALIALLGLWQEIERRWAVHKANLERLKREDEEISKLRHEKALRAVVEAVQTLKETGVIPVKETNAKIQAITEANGVEDIVHAKVEEVKARRNSSGSIVVPKEGDK